MKVYMVWDKVREKFISGYNNPNNFYRTKLGADHFISRGAGTLHRDNCVIKTFNLVEVTNED